MCGFVCVINKSLNGVKEIPDDLLKHRGPDYSEQKNYGNICIRHWRLSIVDLTEDGNQPIEDSQYMFAYNGELYNYNKIGKEVFNRSYNSDTKVFFDLLKSGMINKIKSMTGFYSYILFDKNKNEITGGRDFWGKKPLFYYLNDEVAIFSSEEKAILKLINKKWNLDKETIQTYLEYKNTFNGRSYFEGVLEIPPGGDFYFNIQDWKLLIEPTWSDYYLTPLLTKISPDSLDEKSRSASDEGFIPLIKKAVDVRFSCDVPIQIALSGGVDSCAILTYANSITVLKDKILGALTVKFSDQKDESQKAALIANTLGINHKYINFYTNELLSNLRKAIRFYGGPLDHPHSIAYFLLCEEASKNGKVLITGEGADELFYGYSHYQNTANESFAFRKFLNLDAYFLTNNLSDFSYKNSYIKYRSLALKSHSTSRDMEIKTHLISLLKRNDRMSMAHSVEIRAPFIDLPLLFHSITTDFIDKHKNKSFLKEWINQLMPTYIPDKEKIGFYVPFDDWFEKYSSTEDVQNIICRALTYIDLNLNLKFIKKDFLKIDSRLGWILCNLGIFLEEYDHYVK